jgi:hypothetical protein
MSVNNPLADNSPTDHEDQSLVMRARAGDRKALEDLVQQSLDPRPRGREGPSTRSGALS